MTEPHEAEHLHTHLRDAMMGEVERGRINWAKVLGELLADTEIAFDKKIKELEARILALETRPHG